MKIPSFPDMERPSRRNRHNLGPSVCQPSDVVISHIHRDIWQAMVEPASPTHRESVVERHGDRQRKCTGLETWPFRMFLESLFIMLQITLIDSSPAGCRDTCDRSTRLLRVLSSPPFSVF